MKERGPGKGVVRRIINHFTRPSSGVDFAENLTKMEIRSGVIMKKMVGREAWEKLENTLREIDAITAIAREGINTENEVFSAIWNNPSTEQPKQVQSAIERIENVQREDLGPDYKESLPVPTGEQLSRARLYARTEALMTLIDWKIDDHVTVSRSGHSRPCKLEAKDSEYELQEAPRTTKLPGGKEVIEEVTLVVRKKSNRLVRQWIETLPSYDHLR